MPADETHEVATLLTPAHNYAVVQLPGRRFPGVVFQGDSLANLCRQAEDDARRARGTDAYDDAHELAEHLFSVLLDYVGVLDSHSIALPFEFPPQTP